MRPVIAGIRVTPTAEPMNRGDRNCCVLCVLMICSSVLYGVLRSNQLPSANSGILDVVNMAIALGASIILTTICFCDLSSRRFRNENAKMNWTIAILMFPISILLYIYYFGYYLDRRPQGNHAASSSCAPTGKR